jgi:L-iditol 2-dehydrogenase
VRALVKYARGPGLTEIREVPVPVPAAGEVRVRVEAAAVCASDVHLYHDRFPCEPPLVLGHEFSGVVEQMGPGVSGWRAGEAVVSENNPQACGVCRICRAGFPNLCPEKRAIGFKRHGCFADYVTVPADLLRRVPAGVSFRAAALSEPLAVAIHAVEDRGRVEPGDFVVVLGPGAIGLLAALVARAEGAASVVVAGTGRDTARLAKARELGLGTCHVEQEDLVAEVLSKTGGFGADLVVEAAGAAAAVNAAARVVRRAGRIVAVGITGQQQIPVPWDALVAKGVALTFSYSSRRRNWDKAMDYLRDRRMPLESLITASVPLARWQEAFVRPEQMADIRTLLELRPV